MKRTMRRVPLSVRRMLPVFIGLFIILYSFIVIAKYTKAQGDNDVNTAIQQTTTGTNNNKNENKEAITHENTITKHQKDDDDDDDDEEREITKEIAKEIAMGFEKGSNELRKTHVFYYPWYANMETDGAWNHWNHKVLSHWSPDVARKYLNNVNYVPPDDIGCSYYPMLGPYSSMDDATISEHMRKLKDYVVVVSWWGRPDVKDAKDGEGYSTDAVMPKLFKAAEKFGAKIAFHLEPYPSRTPTSVKEDLKYIISKYGSSPALYRDKDHGNRIVVYMYDSYHINEQRWQSILSPDGSETIRGTDHDALIFGLLLKVSDISSLARSKFDGFYTYFAADGFTGGSKRSNWKRLVTKAKEEGLLTSISVGPGYIDTRIRPWNEENTKGRENGKYYTDGLESAISAKPDYLSITSFNEWHEGTQIEEVVPKTIQHSIENEGGPFTYLDYSPNPPDYYLTLTKEYAEKFENKK